MGGDSLARAHLCVSEQTRNPANRAPEGIRANPSERSEFARSTAMALDGLIFANYTVRQSKLFEFGFSAADSRLPAGARGSKWKHPFDFLRRQIRRRLDSTFPLYQ